MQVQDQPEEEQPADVNPDITIETKKLLPSEQQDVPLAERATKYDNYGSGLNTKIAPAEEASFPAQSSKKFGEGRQRIGSLPNFSLPFLKEKEEYLKGGWYESCSELPIHFDEIKADKATFFDDQQEKKLTPADNMQSYIDNYSVNCKIPAYYVNDAKFFPQDPTHMLQLSTYKCNTSARPEPTESGTEKTEKELQDKEQEVIVHDQEKGVTKSTFAKLHEAYDLKGLVLRLLVRVHTTLKFIDEKQFDETEGFMELNREGNLFAMYFGTENKIQILSINEGELQSFVHKFGNFGSNEGDIEFKGGSDPENDISFIQNMKFDVNKKYLVGWGNNKVFILNLASKEHKIIQNNSRLYNRICDLNFTSNPDDESKYSCYLSCSRKDIKQISNFDLMEDLEFRAKHGTPYHNQALKSNCTINYLRDLQPGFMTKISSDDQQIIFANGKENYIMKTMGSYHEQKKLKQLKTREIKAIKEDYINGGFYFMIHKDYDKFVNVEHSNRTNMDVRFPKKIEPGILKFFDVNIIKSKENQETGMEIRMITQKGDEFQLDKATYDEVEGQSTITSNTPHYLPNKIVQTNLQYFNYIFSPLRAASTSWPFFAISAIGNYILIINAYDPKKVQRVQIAGNDEKITICETYITQTNDLYVATQENQLFKLYTLDLDLINKYDTGQEQCHLKFEQILEYEDEKVKMESLKQIHVRGSSRKETFDMNEKLQVFFLHGDTVYSWIQLIDEQPLRQVCKSTSKMSAINGDKSFYIQYVEKDEETKRPKKQFIKRIDILFSSFDVIKIYAEINLRDKMKTFLVDHSNNKLFIMFKAKNTSGYVDHVLKILELDSTNLIQQIMLTDQKLIGRLKSDIFTFEDGYIYYNNTVIKIRYDLLDKRDSMLTSDQVFDKYPDIFKIGNAESPKSIKFGTPLKSIQSHRFAYIITDDNKKECNQIMLMPFLHERRIYLNKQQVNTEYFYTAVDTPRELIDAYNRNVVLPIKQREETNIKVKSQIDRTPKKYDELKEYRKSKAPTMTSIICFDLLRSSFDVYSQSGQLINQVDYTKMYENHGQPVKISSNGTNVVFKKTLDQLEDAEIIKTSDADLLKEFMSVHIIQVSIFGLNKVKTIDLMSEIKALQKKSQGIAANLTGVAPSGDLDWLFEDNLDYKQMIELIDFGFEITDELEVCVRIAPSKKYKERPGFLAAPKTIFYFENMFQKKEMYLRVEEEDLKFGMNSDYLIFYDTETVKFFNLDSDFKDSNLIHSGFSISKEEHPVIRQLRTTNLSHIIIIVITQNPLSREQKVQDSVIIWDLVKKNEIDSFDLEEQYIIIQDANGNPYIITPTKTHMVMQFCAACAYDCTKTLQKAVESMNGSVTINVSKGVRFDTNNHNWLILYEYLSLGYSYMTFMMRDKIQMRDSCLEGNEFDIEPFNYIYNKTTAYFEGKFVVEDQSRLNDILNNSFRVNPDSLDQLHYTQDVMIADSGPLNIGQANIYKNSALYRAYKSGNQKCIDLILQQMAHIKKNGSANFSHILLDSNDANGFPDYITNLPFQNNQMKGKQVIKVSDEHSEGIIAISHSTTQYVDNKFFAERMGERNDNQARPCEIVALRCGWILKTTEGKQFLNNILQSGNLDHFDIKPLQLIIEFLFQKYKYIIMTTMLPMYLFSHVTYALLNIYMDKFLTDLWLNDKIFEDHDRRLLSAEDGICDHTCDINIKDTDSKYKQFVNIWQTLNLIAAAGQIVIMCCQIYSSGSAYFKRFYSIFDILYVVQIIFTFTAVRLFLQQADMKPDTFELIANVFRKVGIFGTICLFLKASYFLSLLDPVAPLIDIIFQIFFDMKYFIVVLAIFILMIAMCFNLLASLQVDFDYIPETADGGDAISQISYFYPQTAFWYGMQFMFGGASNAAFTLGEGKQAKYLDALHFAANFLIVLHLLNMLIAIMGSTYGNREAVGSQIMKKDHLRFVMDNWILLHLAFFNDYNRLEFLICALPLNEEDDDQLLQNFYSKFQSLVKTVDNQFGMAKILQNETQLMVMELKNAERSQRNVE